jgi:DNA-binding NarL/FixJ family response regulator
MPELTRFLVVDDHPIFRQGLVAVVQSNPAYRVVAEAGDVAQALSALESNAFDVALIDISLGGQSGLDLVKMIQAAKPSVLSLIISIHDEAIYAERALKAKSRGYVMKQEAGSVLLEAIRVVLSGHIYLSPQMRDRMIESRYLQRDDKNGPMVERLSDRELEVLEHLGWGYGASEIASRLKLSVKTVGVYQDHIKKKLGIDGAAELRKFAAHWIQSQRK